METERGTTSAEKCDIFYHLFRDKSVEIDERLDELQNQGGTADQRKDAVQACQTSIDKVTVAMVMIKGILPAHDLRTYNDAIKGWDKRLKQAQDALAPRKKFSFKSGASAGAAAGRSASMPAPGHSTGDDNAHASEQQGTGGNPNASSLSSDSSFPRGRAVNLDDHYEQHLVLPSLTDGILEPGSIVNIHSCVIDRRRTTPQATPLASLTLRTISRSLILCGRVAGPVHLTGITDSIIVVSTQQFRMHDSRVCDVYLHAGSRPILENCEAVRFAPLPGIHQIESGEAEGSDMWRQVDDFNWHRTDPSPHWRVLEQEERVSDEVWRHVVPGRPHKGVKDVLEAVGIVKGRGG